ncbi:MAG: hypothetical protein M5U28_50855 [Sandaracinaceae bacterium]|nr:hypothetical protein [Sandaracinaceae bacterium]
MLRALDSAGEPMRGEVACLRAKGRAAEVIHTFTRQDVLAGIERLDAASRTLVPRATLRSALRIADRAEEALERFERRLERLQWRPGAVVELLQELREELAQITARHRGYGLPSLSGQVSMTSSAHYGLQIVARHRQALERWRRFQREAPDLLPADRARLVELAEVVAGLEPGIRRWDDESIAAVLRIEALVASLSEWTPNPLRWGPGAALEGPRAACGALFAR